jgi:hypothetical protein
LFKKDCRVNSDPAAAHDACVTHKPQIEVHHLVPTDDHGRLYEKFASMQKPKLLLLTSRYRVLPRCTGTDPVLRAQQSVRSLSWNRAAVV